MSPMPIKTLKEAIALPEIIFTDVRNQPRYQGDPSLLDAHNVAFFFDKNTPYEVVLTSEGYRKMRFGVA